MRLALLGMLLTARALAAPVAMPIFDPDSRSTQAPLKVLIRCATPEASIHITLDGDDPTPRDTEVESGASVELDEPGTLKARAWLPDGSVSPVKVAAYALTPVPGLGVSFVEQSVSEQMVAGRSYQVSVVLRNIGTQPWTPGSVALVPRRARDGAMWNVAQVALRDAVATWKTATLSYRVTAPAAAGIYNFQWRMQALSGTGGVATLDGVEVARHDGSDSTPFGDPTPIVRVRVVLPEDSTAATQAAGLGQQARTAGMSGARASAKAESLPEPVARLAAANGVSPGSDIERIVRALARSPHSFKALRERGFTQSDAEFEKILAKHRGLFRSVRIVRRDEQGQRVIPGWPGIDLNMKRR